MKFLLGIVIFVGAVFFLFYPFIMMQKRWRGGAKNIAVLYAAVGIIIIIVLGKVMVANYLRYSNTKQLEAIANLGIIYKHQNDYFQKEKEYAQTIEELGWAPVGATRYSYFLNETDLEGVAVEVPEDGFIAVAIANLDEDPWSDIWVIDNKKQLRRVVDDIRDMIITTEGINVFNSELHEFIKSKRKKGILLKVFLGIVLLFYIGEPIIYRSSASQLKAKKARPIKREPL